MGPSPTLLKEIAGFRRRLSAALGSVETVVLFGSQARGTPGSDSDVDVIVVSRAFEGMRPLDRAVIARRSWQLPHPVDILCYTPAQFDRLKKEISIVSTALEEGVEIGA